MGSLLIRRGNLRYCLLLNVLVVWLPHIHGSAICIYWLIKVVCKANNWDPKQLGFNWKICFTRIKFAYKPQNFTSFAEIRLEWAISNCMCKSDLITLLILSFKLIFVNGKLQNSVNVRVIIHFCFSIKIF